MIGNKLRSWMEAVRPKKKQQQQQQQRKEKSNKNAISNCSNAVYVTNMDSVCNSKFPEKESAHDLAVRKSIIGSECRYSGTNLSSPESAYSTGYSTDGTSPGAPPEYYVNIRKGSKYLKNIDKSVTHQPLVNQSVPVYGPINNRVKLNGNFEIVNDVEREPFPNTSAYPPQSSKIMPKVQEEIKQKSCLLNTSNSGESSTLKSSLQNNVTLSKNGKVQVASPSAIRLSEGVVSSNITSPRQRNRIRTNPWLPSGNSLSPGTSSVTLHPLWQEPFASPLLSNASSRCIVSSKIENCHIKHGSQSVRRESLSSSSCSSLSDENNPWDSKLIHTVPNSLNLDGEDDEEDDDDCTLNEMMGKYDESYVYEKETDILSDSDPTDCETDIDTGQDGGDEEEATEKELDFIDNGSLKEYGYVEKEIKNTGHCVYFSYEGHTRQISRRKTTRRSQKTDPKNGSGEKRKKSSSFWKRSKNSESNYVRTKEEYPLKNGSKSAGATPISVRKTKRSLTRKIHDEQKRRSNSVSYSETINLIDKRDIEAEKKYKELIVEAEHILMTMKTNGVSPRRLPTPANKRVEMLRNGESPIKSDGYLRNRLIEETANLHLSKIPSNTLCSPKKNHLVNFINNNSHQLIRRETETTFVNKKHLSPKLSRKSPKFKKKITKTLTIRRNSSSSEDENENEKRPKRNHIVSRNDFLCPQSEPVKRKCYFNDNKIFPLFNNYEGLQSADSNKPYSCNRSGLDINNSGDNLRQQVLLSTIANLKRSLEDQSASLKQVCRNSQQEANIKIYK